MKNRMLAVLLMMCMVVTIIPNVAMAQRGQADIGISAACAQHQDHDANCGYRAQVAAAPCAHQGAEGTDSCAALPQASAIENAALPVSAADAFSCTHGDDCGYTAEGSGEVPCTHTCTVCVPVGSVAVPPSCDCTEPCTPADAGNGMGAVARADCPTCGAENADLGLCAAIASIVAVPDNACPQHQDHDAACGGTAESCTHSCIFCGIITTGFPVYPSLMGRSSVATAPPAPFLALGDSISTGYGLPAGSSSFLDIFNSILMPVNNKAANGAKMSDLKSLVTGTTIDADIAAAKMITITMGGNDLMDVLYQKTADALKKTVQETKDLLAKGDGIALLNAVGVINSLATGTDLDATIASFQTDLLATIAYIKAKNPNVQILVCTQYQPYQWVTAFDPLNPNLEICVEKLNKVIRENATASDYKVADVHKAFAAVKAKGGDTLTNASSTGTGGETAYNMDFHPNKDGHAEIFRTIAMDMPVLVRYKPVTPITENGVTATVSYDLPEPQLAAQSVALAAMVTLSGTATETGTHTINLSSINATFVGGTKTVAVTANTVVNQTLTYTVATPVSTTSVDITPVLLHNYVKAPTYAVTMQGGTSSHATATQGTAVTLTANAAPSGQQFRAWVVSPVVTFTVGSLTTPTATFTMPNEAVTAQATYENIPASTYSIGGKVTGSDASGGIAATLQLTDASPATVYPSVTATADGVYRFDDVAAGTYTLAVSCAGYKSATTTSFTVAADVQSKDITLVAKGVPSLTVSDITKSYDGTAVTSVTGTAKVGGATVAGTFAFAANTPELKNAGTYSVTVHFTPNDTAEFVSTTTNITVKINKLPLTVKAEDKSMYYTHVLPVLTVKYTGFIAGEDATTAFVGTAYTATTTADGKTVGTYAITISGNATATNYTITTENGTLIVLQKKLVSATDTMPTSPTVEAVAIPATSLPVGTNLADLRLSVSYGVTAADRTALNAATAGKAGFVNKINLEISLIDTVTQLPVQPGGEITIFIPYPTGTNKNDTFVLLHALSNGTVQEIVPTKRESGLQFNVSSLSPFAIGWTKHTAPGGGGSSGGGSGSSGNGNGGSTAITYTITATAGAGGTISTGEKVQVPEGDSAGFTITPRKGYQIADVRVNGKSIGAKNTYVFTNVRSNQTIHATFKQAGHVNPKTGVAVR